MDFRCGDRVRIAGHFEFEDGIVGTIEIPPKLVATVGGDFDGPLRELRLGGEVIRCYWVRFDVPQRTTDGEGPYREAEFFASCLQRIEQP